MNSVGARLRVKQGDHIRMKTRSETGRERLIERETAERATHKYYEKSIKIQEQRKHEHYFQLIKLRYSPCKNCRRKYKFRNFLKGSKNGRIENITI